MNRRTSSGASRLMTVVLSWGVLGCGHRTDGQAAGSGAPQTVLPIALSGSVLSVTRPDGTKVVGKDLVGATLVVATERGILPVRIDAVTPDKLDASGETLLYTASLKDDLGPFCEPDPWGDRVAIPISGSWTPQGKHVADPDHFELMCTGGAIAKCVRFGYQPWKSAHDWDLHQACTRMVRADYCGDGIGHTKTGTPIDVFDHDGIQADEIAPGMTFEAGWGTGGAVCVAKTRIPSVFTFADVQKSCPAAIGPLGECTEEMAKVDPRALIFDRTGPNGG